MKMNVIKRYECPICNEEHESVLEAYFCCFGESKLISLTDRAFCFEFESGDVRTTFKCMVHIEHLEESLFVAFEYNFEDSSESEVGDVLRTPLDITKDEILNDSDIIEKITEFLIDELDTLFGSTKNLKVLLKDDYDLSAKDILACSHVEYDKEPVTI